MAVGPVSPLVLERYELKYLIPLSMVEPISRYVEMFCTMDYYSQISHDYYYTINSLYFDTPTGYFFRSKVDKTGRISMRVRSYGEGPKAPYFFEIKEKTGDFCKKRRGLVPIESWSQLFTDPDIPQTFDPSKSPHVASFLALAHTFGSVPTILTQYRRKAYLSTVDDYARVTFDRGLRCYPETRYNVYPDDQAMINYDHPTTFEDPGMNIILELKCERKIPVWMVDLIRRFNLTRGAFSKFESAMMDNYSKDDLSQFAYGRMSNI